MGSFRVVTSTPKPRRRGEFHAVEVGRCPWKLPLGVDECAIRGAGRWPILEDSPRRRADRRVEDRSSRSQADMMVRADGSGAPVRVQGRGAGRIGRGAGVVESESLRRRVPRPGRCRSPDRGGVSAARRGTWWRSSMRSRDAIEAANRPPGQTRVVVHRPAFDTPLNHTALCGR